MKLFSGGKQASPLRAEACHPAGSRFLPGLRRSRHFVKAQRFPAAKDDQQRRHFVAPDAFGCRQDLNNVIPGGFTLVP